MASSEQAARLGHDSIPSLLWKFSVPSTIATVLHGTYNIVDRIFVGQAIGEEGLTALAIAMPVMMIMMAFGMMFGRGGSALISIHLGEKNPAKAEQILGMCFTLFAILAVVFTVFCLIFIEPLLRTFGADDRIMPMAREYLSIILWGTLFHEISFGVNSFIRAEGNARTAMLTAFVAAGLNVVLDPLFLFVFKLGVAGAAWATIIAQFASAAWVMWYYMSGRSLLRLHWKNMRIYANKAWRVTIVGSPPFLMNVFSCLTLAVLNNSLRQHGGNQSIAVMSVLFTVMSMVYMPLIGITQGAQPIFGYNLGATNYGRVRATLRLTVVVSTVLCLAVYALVTIFPQSIFTLFEKDNSGLGQAGISACRYYMVLLPFVGTIFVATNYFQAINKPAESIFLSFGRQVIFMGAILVFPLWWGLNGIWMAEPAATAMGFLISAAMLVREQKKLARRQLELESAVNIG